MISSFEQSKDAAPIVLIGSSVLTLPMSLLEMDESTFNTDTWLHRKNFFVDALKLDTTGAAASSNQAAFDMTFTGAMVSDSYLMARKYALAGGKKPEWLVLGVIPRDVMDTRPNKTLQFSCLPTIKDFSWVKPLYLKTFNDRVDFLMSQVCFFHTYSWWMKGKAEDALRNLPIDYPQTTVRTIDQKDPAKRWEASIKEYRGLYARPRKKVVADEYVFLEQLGALARQNSVKLLVVNMPIPAENRDLLPNGFYSNYKKMLAGISRTQNAIYLDLESSDNFVRDDYFDSSHLNRKGAAKFCRIISETVMNSQVSAASK